VTLRGSNYIMVFLILYFTLCPFETKRDSIFLLGPRLYFLTGQVIFVPEWPNGEFVSLWLAALCWTKSFLCNDAYLNRYVDYIQSLQFYYVLQEDSVRISKQLVQFPCIHLDDVVFHPGAHLSSIIHQDNENFLSGPPIYVKKLQTIPSCIHPDILTTLPDALQCSTSTRISFQNTNMGRQLQTIRTSGPHYQDAILDKASRSEDVQPSGRQTPLSRCSGVNMEIECSRSATVRTLGKHRPNTALFRKE
jgi:hypothetical protein